MQILAPHPSRRIRPRRAAVRRTAAPLKPDASRPDPSCASWISPESFEAVSQHLATAKPSLTGTKIPRIWQSRLGNLPIITKVEQLGDESDDIERESRIGLLVNRLRNSVPNFVATLGSYVAPSPTPVPEVTSHVRHLVLEKIPGRAVRTDVPLDEHLRVLVQITQVLHFAYTKHEFTHYNLHRDNVLLRPLDQEHVIEYSDDCRLQVKAIAVVIDFGRSYTRETGGRAFDLKGVENRPDWSHDITYFFSCLLKEYYPAELTKLLGFYNISIDLNRKTHENLVTVPRDAAVLRHPDEFLHFIESEFNFHACESKPSAPILRPTPLQWDAQADAGSSNAFERPTSLAIKIQRRQFPDKALHEIGIHQMLQRQYGQTPCIAALRHTFLHDGHICGAYEQHGCSLDTCLDDDGRFPVGQVQCIARQVLIALTQLHGCGHSHSDLKPENILWEPASRIAKLADLGNADAAFRRGVSLGTRNYLAPEVLLGAHRTLAIDLWSLGCTLFELLTGDYLFNPRAAAAEKYREFYFYEDEDAPQERTPEPVAADNRVWAAEQYAPGSRLHESYRLEQRLGNGTFGTVWSAALLSPEPYSDPWETLVSHAESVESAEEEAPSEAEEQARAWRKTNGAKDLKDLALNYEHLLLIVRQAGPLPPRLISDAKFRATYCDPDGVHLRHRPEIVPLPLLSRLEAHLSPTDAQAADKFLSALLQVDHALRPTAQQALDSEWLRE